MAKGYQQYRGRKGGWRKVLAVLLLLVTLGALALLLLQDRIIFDADGGARLQLPFLEERTQPPQPATEPQAGELIIEAPLAQPLPLPEPEPIEPEIPSPLHLRALPQSVLQGGWQQEMAEAGDGYHGWMVMVKSSDGQILYDSKVEAAVDCGAVSGSVASAALTELLAVEGYHVARLSCFHDSIYSKANMTGAGLCQPTGYVWFDNRNTHWLDPSKPEARTYLSALVAELAAKGFDEILLEDFTYPTKGKLHKINYADMPMSREQALLQAAQELQAAVEDTDCRLSVAVTEELLLTGSDADAGLSLTLLTQSFDRLYVPTTAQELPNLQAIVAAADTQAQLIPILSAPIEGDCVVETE